MIFFLFFFSLIFFFKFVTKQKDLDKIQGKISNEATEFCSRYGRYRQPFAISALQVFDNKGQLLLNENTEFTGLYARTGREDLFTALQSLKDGRKEKLGKDLRGMCRITVEKILDIGNLRLFDSSLRCIQNHNKDQDVEVQLVDDQSYLQIHEFLQQPRLTPNFHYVNNLYMYPISANLGKLNAKTICLKIEVKDTDNFKSACLNVSFKLFSSYSNYQKS